jgi:hypothetical protein
MAVREAFTDGVAAKYGYDNDMPAAFAGHLQKAGYDPAWAKFYWRAKWELPSATMGYEMLHRGVIDSGTLDELLRVQDYPSYWRSKLTQISYNPLTRVDVRRMFKMGIIGRTEVLRSYLDLGYDATKAEWLTRFTEVTYPPDPEDPTQTNRDLTRDVITRGYQRGIITREQAAAQLAAIGYDASEIEFLLSLADADKLIDTTPDYTLEHQRDIIAVIERAYTRANISPASARSAFASVGLDAAEIGIRMTILDSIRAESVTEDAVATIGKAYVSRANTRAETLAALGQFNIPGGAQLKIMAEWEWTREHGDRRLTASQYQEAYDLKIVNLVQYKEAMRGLGYAEKDVAILGTLASWYETH